MGLESLFLFTLLGGLAAGTYVFETCFQRIRTEKRPWLISLIVAIVLLISIIAALTHIHDFSHMFEALSRGTVNVGSGILQEVIAVLCVLVLVVIDFVLCAIRGKSPYVLRVITAVVGIVCIVLMGAAYVDVYGVPVWCNALATILTFVAGDLAMGAGLFTLLANVDYDNRELKITSVLVNVVLIVGMCLEIADFAAYGMSSAMLIASLIIAPIASIVFVLASTKFTSKAVPVAIVFVLSVVGIAISRYAFYTAFALA